MSHQGRVFTGQITQPTDWKGELGREGKGRGRGWKRGERKGKYRGDLSTPTMGRIDALAIRQQGQGW